MRSPATALLNVDTGELRPELEQVLTRHFDQSRAISSMVRKPSLYQSSFPLEELDVWLDDGTRLQLIVKDLSLHEAGESGWVYKPEFLRDPRREIETYRHILTPNRIGPRCYGAMIDEDRGRYWLFLEKVAGRELYQVGDLATWERVSAWLAEMHAHVTRETRESQAVPLLFHDVAFYRQWVSRASSYHAAPAISKAPTLGAFEWLIERHDRMLQRALEIPATFIHGEFYASNVLIEDTAEEGRIRPVDWEMAAIGPCLMDLAALTSGGWRDEDKIQIAFAYHEALSLSGVWQPSCDAFLAALDACRFLLALQWLGWSQAWSPPLAHATDWMAEAIGSAKRLES